MNKVNENKQNETNYKKYTVTEPIITEKYLASTSPLPKVTRFLSNLQLKCVYQ